MKVDWHGVDGCELSGEVQRQQEEKRREKKARRKERLWNDHTATYYVRSWTELDLQQCDQPIVLAHSSIAFR